MTEKVFAEGIFWNEKHEKAPDYVLGSISVIRDVFTSFLAKQEVSEKGYVKFVVKMSKGGKPYVELDTWKPGIAGEASGITQEPRKEEKRVIGHDGEEIPF